ncbi:outer membrane protein assembly factor BamD [Vibrio mexicanus]|uniref:outer membrane protein assembly factor BamD n=1 Tax=Vibrio mexicanus TaxID=1004326 RepID=UPI00063CA5A4|nr:outer membrane protein assembly factor BamD [Vibrio mexicanus]
MNKHTLSGLLALSLLFGCSSSEEIVPDVPPSELYSEAQQSLQGGNWLTAIERLEALDSRYPFGAYSEQVQLDLIYAYYKNDDLALGLATIERFNRLNPTHDKLDWVLYMRGLTHMAQDRNFMHDLFNMDRSDRDPEPVISAFNDFKRLLERYPNSPYAADAKKRMFALKNRLAAYDLATADFYLRREAWIAAINRAQELQKTFPDTEAARQSLEIQLEAYEQLGLEEQAERTRQLIDLNPS